MLSGFSTLINVLAGCKAGIIGAGEIEANDVSDSAFIPGSPARIARYRNAEFNN